MFFSHLVLKRSHFCNPRALRLALKAKIPDTNAQIYPEYQQQRQEELPF